MRKLTLELIRREKSSASEVLSGLFGNTQELQSIVLARAFKVFQPKALNYIWHIRESVDLGVEPHQIWVDYKASFVNADFVVDNNNDKLTVLGNYLNDSDGYLLTDDESWTNVLRNFPEKPYWNPEWPLPMRIKLAWEENQPPFELSVICGADSDEQMAHLLTHNHLDDILNGMLPIIEGFLNRRVQEVLQSEPVKA